MTSIEMEHVSNCMGNTGENLIEKTNIKVIQANPGLA